MAVGLDPTKAEIDTVAGGICRDIHTALGRAVDFKFWLDSKTVTDLEAMGWSTGEANNMKSAFADTQQLADIYNNVAALASAKDFRAFTRRLFGLGGVT